MDEKHQGVRKSQVSFGLSFHPVIDFLFDPAAPENTQKETHEVDEKTKDLKTNYSLC
jgi:hypothetical protein